MPDELDNKPLGYWDDYFRPAGFTLADVRRLLENVRTRAPAHLIVPFASLLKENKDAP